MLDVDKVINALADIRRIDAGLEPLLYDRDEALGMINDMLEAALRAPQPATGDAPEAGAELTEPEWLQKLREGLELAPHPLNLYETGKDLVAVVVRLRADLATVTSERDRLEADLDTMSNNHKSTLKALSVARDLANESHDALAAEREAHAATKEELRYSETYRKGQVKDLKRFNSEINRLRDERDGEIQHANILAKLLKKIFHIVHKKDAVRNKIQKHLAAHDARRAEIAR